MIWRVMKGCEGLAKPFIALSHWYIAYYNQFMKGEGLTRLSFEGYNKC